MVTISSWHVAFVIWREVITELSVMKIYLNSHKQRLGVTLLSARLLSLGTLPPSRPSELPLASLTCHLHLTNIPFSLHNFVFFTLITITLRCLILYHTRENVICFYVYSTVQTSTITTISLNKVSTYYLNQCRPQFL